jgi:hypothetical protein
VPVNVAALRVSDADATGVTPRFQGNAVAFDKLPYGPLAKQASTGDMVWRPLQYGDSPTPALERGIHLHWELPEHFRRGTLDPDTHAIAFPHAPTRWLVVRSLSVYDTSRNVYGAMRHTSWVIESDFVAAQMGPDRYGIIRPTVAVPLTVPPGLLDSGRPYMYMGRVVEAASWDPKTERPADYLPAYTDPSGNPLYLTAIGFAGAAFPSYYPDCRSVFGFWDSFADADDVYKPMEQNNPLRFRVSYSLMGWLPDPAEDPLTSLPAAVTSAYDDYVRHCVREQVPVDTTPTAVFQRIASERYGWEFSANAISYTLGEDHLLTSLEVPEATICAGVVQDVVWKVEDPSVDTPFLAAPDDKAAWTDDVEIAVGNTTPEAVSALVKSQLPAPHDKGVLASYETVLNALQLGLLRELEPATTFITLEEALHENAFTKVDGGHLWTVQAAATPDTPDISAPQLTLPLTLAEELNLLNAAQQAYDTARDRLVVIRQQLFMDWIIFVKQLVANPASPVIPTNAFSSFLVTSTGGELNEVIAEGARVGLVSYERDPQTGHIVGISTTAGPGTLAATLVAAYKTVKAALDDLDAEWRLDAIPGPAYWQATDPVLLMEGERLEPVRRNGPTTAIAVRSDGELVGALDLRTASASYRVEATAVHDLPVPPAPLPFADVATALMGEGALLDPQYAAAIAAASGAADPSALATAIAASQGGQSPLDGASDGGLYAAVRAPGYRPVENPTETVQAPVALTVTFTNAGQIALAPDAVGWNAQTALPEFSPTRMDPFLPVWLTWTVCLDPLARGDQGYAAKTMEDCFALDADGVDYVYPLPPSFTTGGEVKYRGAVVLSKKPTVSLAEQISRYMADYPDDIADPELQKARDDIAGRKIMSQALDTLSLEQTLRTTIPQIPVVDLVKRPDLVTAAIARAATAIPGDSWYVGGFNSLTPTSTGIGAEYNFGPLRAGFMEIQELRIVDGFGQLMDLDTASRTSSGALKIAPSAAMSPVAGDEANAEKAYLHPRLLAPCRVDAHWLSATHNDEVPGVTSDFVEMNDHPATSPVCGWIVPNHLEVSLAFYDADGSPIGSFGIEHGDNVYRTRAGNTSNPGNNLEIDLSQPGINVHVARVMRFVYKQSGGFLRDLMSSIAGAEGFISPLGSGQDVALSTLIGRPLAIARTVQAISSSAGALPVSQANTSASDALAQVVKNGWTRYDERQAHTSAALDTVRFSIRFGDLMNIDDGLVAYLPESSDTDPYSIVYSPAAPADGGNGVKRPDATTVEATVNAAPQTFTMIVDPRAPVHVTTGVLPTASLRIPPDQYLRAMQQLAVTFTTRPVLRDQLDLRLPLPVQVGFGWAWIAPGEAPQPLTGASSSDVPIYGYGPQRVLEGWLDLIPNPPTPEQGRG